MDDNIVRFKKELAQEGKRGLALDIDETLSYTTRYWFEQMQILFGNPENLMAVEMIKKYRYTEYVPYWQHEKAMKWMESKREDDKLQEDLPLIENANHMVQKISEIIPVVAYLTARPQTVIKGTKKWLVAHGFPDVPVIARPVGIGHEKGNGWKAKTLDYLYPQVLGIIDDNPDVIDKLPKQYKGTVYLYSNSYSSNKLRVVCCPAWNDVLKAVTVDFGRETGRKP